jgi:hypothetical protein
MFAESPQVRYESFSPFSFLDALLDDLPHLLAGSVTLFRERILSIPDILKDVEQTSNKLTLAALFRDFSYLTTCWCLIEVY